MGTMAAELLAELERLEAAEVEIEQALGANLDRQAAVINQLRDSTHKPASLIRETARK